MTVSGRRVRAIFGKELREYRHNGNIVYAMVIFPVVFLIQPLIQIFTLPSSASPTLHHEDSLVYMLAIPALVPAALASYSIVGERLQGTLGSSSGGGWTCSYAASGPVAAAPAD